MILLLDMIIINDDYNLVLIADNQPDTQVIHDFVNYHLILN